MMFRLSISMSTITIFSLVSLNSCSPKLHFEYDYTTFYPNRKNAILRTSLFLNRDSTFKYFTHKGSIINDGKIKNYGNLEGTWEKKDKTLYLFPSPNYVKFIKIKNLESDLSCFTIDILNFNYFKNKYELILNIKDMDPVIITKSKVEICDLKWNSTLEFDISFSGTNHFGFFSNKIKSEKIIVKNPKSLLQLEFEEFYYRFNYADNPVDSMFFKIRSRSLKSPSQTLKWYPK
jgi:hypothetical protein